MQNRLTYGKANAGDSREDNGHFAMPFAIFLFIFSVVSFFLLPQIVWFYTWIFSDNKLYEFVCKTPMPW